jgi:hypothetical protein
VASKLILAPWDGSVIRCGCVTTSARGEAAPERGKKGDDASWTDANLTRQKKKKIHAVHSTAINVRGRFKATMS